MTEIDLFFHKSLKVRAFLGSYDRQFDDRCFCIHVFMAIERCYCDFGELQINFDLSTTEFGLRGLDPVNPSREIHILGVVRYTLQVTIDCDSR